MTKIPLVCLSFNQPTYLQGLILHWRFYHPDPETHPIYVFDNGSTSEKLKDLLSHLHNTQQTLHISFFDSNNFIPNLTDFLQRWINPRYDYYVLSDCDILPHPSTPYNYLEVLKHLIDSGYHRAGFGLITDDLPDCLHLKNNIIHDENSLLHTPVNFEFEGKQYSGFRAPIDTTYALYSTKNGGWSAPMNAKDWGNCVRLFKAHHLTWYLDPERINPEMDYYFKSAKYRVPGEPSAGANNSRPEKYIQ